MDQDAVRALFDQQIRQALSDASPPAHGAVRAVGSDGDWAAIVWSDLDAATVDLAIAEQVDRFAPLGRDFEWKLYAHDRPADLGSGWSRPAFARRRRRRCSSPMSPSSPPRSRCPRACGSFP